MLGEWPEGPLRDARALLRGGLTLRRLGGLMKGGTRHLNVAYLGTNEHAEQCEAFFEGPPLRASPGLRRPDVVLMAEPLPLPAQGALQYTPFLDAVLDVAPTVEEQIAQVRSKAHRRRLRKVFRTRDWRWSVGERPEDLEHFYRVLHQPYVDARFGAQRHHTSLESLLARLRQGGRVLTVTHRGEPVCGAALFELRDGGIDYDRNGFRLDALASPIVLAERTAALELAVFQLAQELLARTIFLGFCRAFLDDGLFTHKRRLGCRFQAARGSGRTQLWVRPALRPQVFSAVPLVAGPCGAFEAHVGLAGEAPPLPKLQWRARLKNFALPSVRRAVVWTDVEALDPRRVAFEGALRAAMGQRPVELRTPRDAVTP